jgi:aminodeoxyfutalosine synthase
VIPLSDSVLGHFAASYDILTVGMAADEERRRRHGARTTFVRVATVGADPAEAAIVPPAAGEVRIAGVPASLEQALARIRSIVPLAGGRPVTGFSLADLEALAPREGTTLRALLEAMAAEGLELVAEAPFDRLRDPRRAIEEVNIAGLRLARLTIHQLPDGDALELYRRVQTFQDQVGVIPAFAPLPRTVNPAAPTTGFDDVKRVALARLGIDIPSIQVDWALYGPKLAQVALTVGADDLDGVPATDEAPDGPRRAAREEVRRNILAAGLEPVERDGRFDVRP